MERIAEAGGDWDDVRAAAAEECAERVDGVRQDRRQRLFGVAGHRTQAIEYLVGNHVIAETMFRHDPRRLLYAPLRMLIYSDADGNAVFTMDQPSPAFGSLGIAEVAEVGARGWTAKWRTCSASSGWTPGRHSPSATNPVEPLSPTGFG